MNLKYWNSLASDFENRVLEIANHDLHGVIKAQVERLSGNCTTAADLGCGTGSLIPYIWNKFDTVFAVDYADELINVARKNNDYHNVEYYCHDLLSTKPLPFTADVIFSVNTLISPEYDDRQAMAKSLWRTNSKNGYTVVVVPSMESVTHVYQSLVRCSVKEEVDHRKAVRDITRLYKKEVISPVEGIVSIGGTPTKCFTREEISIFLSEIGYTVEDILRVEYPWTEDIDDAPRWLKDPFPWDWLIISRKS